MTRCIGVLWTAMLALSSGCSGPTGGAGPAREPQEVTLYEVADMVRAASQNAGRGPTKLSDFDRSRSLYPNGYQAIKSGEVVVLWGGGGVKGEGEMAKGGGVVIAHAKTTPTEGGYVLLDSGEVKKMTAAEFAAAPKAGKK